MRFGRAISKRGLARTEAVEGNGAINNGPPSTGDGNPPDRADVLPQLTSLGKNVKFKYGNIPF